MFFDAFLLMVSLAGQAPPPASSSADTLSQAYVLFFQGRELDDRDDAAGAIAAYRRALELVPDAAEVHAELAGVLARDRQTDAAIKTANGAIAIDPKNRTAHRILGLLKGEMAEQAGDQARAASLRSEAIASLEIVVADRLVDPTAELTLGRLYVQAGQFPKAIETLRLFLLDRPDYPDALLLLANAYEHTHDLASAIETLEAAAAVQPDQARISTWLANLQEQSGRWTAAAAVWGRLAEAHPRNASYRNRQATALVNGGEISAGRQTLTRLTEQNPRDVGAWYLLSQVDRRAGDPARAEEDARRIAEIDPADPRGPLALAEAKAARGDYRGVVAVLDPLVREPRTADVENGWHARMAGHLASALAEIGDRTRAISVLEAAYRRDRRNTDLLFDLGAAYERARRFDRAEETLREVIASEPRNAAALNYLGYMLAEQGKKLDEAVELISRALAIQADNPSFLDSLGWAYVKQSKLDRARDPLQRAAAALPRTSVIQDHLAELYFRLKRYSDAVAAWDRALDGDREGIDVGAVTKKRDRARALAGQ